MTKQTKKSNSSPSTAKPKKERYISLNMDELAALESLGFRERWAYMVFKNTANFKTGVVGEFGKQKLSHVGLAAMIKAPPGIQGRGEGSIDDTQAREFLARMEAVGLVSGIGRRTTNGGLRFDLPMSPIGRNKAKQPLICVGKKAVISPDEVVPEIAANPEPERGGEESASYQSVMINKKINISNEGAFPSDDGNAPSRATGAAPFRENPEGGTGAPVPLSAQQIHDALHDCWTFVEINTPEAWELYEAWAGKDICLDDLHAAMISLEENENFPDPRPCDLVPQLWAVVLGRSSDQMSA